MIKNSYKSYIYALALAGSLLLSSCKNGDDKLDCKDYDVSTKEKTDKLILGVYDNTAKKYTQEPNVSLSAVKCACEIGKLDVNEKYSQYEWTRFLAIVNNGAKIDVVKYLVEDQKADVKAKTTDGWTALHSSVSEGNKNLEITKYLISKGADVNAKRDEESGLYTPLMVSVDYKTSDVEIVKYLISKNADVHAKDKNNNSVLKIAATSSNLEVVKYLVEDVKLDPKEKSDSGNNAFTISVYNSLDIVKYLEGRGGDFNQKDKYDWTTLMNAANGGNLDIVKYIMTKMPTLTIKTTDVTSSVSEEYNVDYESKTACQIVDVDVSKGYKKQALGTTLKTAMNNCT